jgi:hypothetical protein
VFLKQLGDALSALLESRIDVFRDGIVRGKVDAWSAGRQ